ncbi:MAG: glycosyltransferase family 4 protein [Anaerolineae bacterium]|nr:glycosyltransferase family 4 protein [Anaerolineae bacterium]
MMKTVLVTVSGIIDPQIEAATARGERPQADYIALAQHLDADLLDYVAARKRTGRFGALLETIGGPNVMLAWACFQQRKRYSIMLTDGEQVGIPLACLLKYAGLGISPQHVMIGHILSVPKKMLFFDWLKLQSHIHTFVVYSSWQKQFIQDRWHVSPERVKLTPFMVDAHFFKPDQADGPSFLSAHPLGQQPLICSVGLEFRDYPTLLAAVREQPVEVMIAAASPWSKRSDTTSDQTIPSNVTVQRFTHLELRNLYAASRFVVIPLYNVNFQAGITAILEAMAMEKAVICSQVPGQTDVIVNSETGLYVPPQDPQALQNAISYLLNHPAEAERMGKNGRRFVEQVANLESYVSYFNAIKRSI